MKYVKSERIHLKTSPHFNEKWIQEKIAEDPSMLGLGDLILKDKERIQSSAGRLDLLLQEADSNRRFEVELQLGKTDETHIIRTIEYWDIERKRYPQYDHTAVIIAEDITSRFLNVISLFNGFIPLVAIQLQAYKTGEQMTLVFTKVLDQVRLGLVDEDEEVQEATNRAYWEQRASKSTVAITDELLTILQQIDPELALKYNKFYIGIARQGITRNFASFVPKKEWVRLEIRLQKTDEIGDMLAQSDLDLMEYNTRLGQYRIRIEKDALKKHETLIKDLLDQAYKEFD